MKNLVQKPNKKAILKATLTSFAASHPRLVTMGIYAGVALAISAAIGFALHPEEQAAFAISRPQEWW